MRSSEELEREIASLRERMARLSSASLRISESLDLESVLHEVVDSARALTGAANAAITTVDRTEQFRGFISSGVTDEERRQLWDLPQGERLWGYLLQIQRPLRVDDLASHLDALGIATAPILRRSFMGAQIRHRGVNVGHFYLTNKEGGQGFTEEDEETLVLFASQAAAAIANAQAYREEQRARADLEALVDTSPVGVVVFDAKAGQPSSLNREAMRMVDLLRTPDQAPEDLLSTMSVRRGDGREVSLEEFPVAEALRRGESVRLEEIVLRVPDGRSVTALMNATSIRSEEGDVESVVVTLQDMTSLEEMERLRAEFLAMVSHELRAPLTSIKGSAATLIGSGDSLDPAEALQFHRIIDDQADHMRSLITDLLDVARIETGTLSVSSEASEVSFLVDRARNSFLSGGGRDNIHIEMELDLPPVMADRRRIVQVLVNLLTNAARHSPEPSAITMDVRRSGYHIAFSVADEGVGLSPDRLPHLFRKHSRIDGDDPTGIEGSGVGLAICKGIVEAHGGRIWAESEGHGMGTRLSFTLPVVEDARYDFSKNPPRFPDPAQGTRRGRTRVLVVDDDPQTLRYVRDSLTEAGFVAIVTADPEEVGQLMNAERPHLVLLDLMLPGTDGIELMEDVPALGKVPVIFISAYGGGPAHCQGAGGRGR